MSRCGNVPTREEAKPSPVQPSVTLKVGLEEYKEKLNQLEKLVEGLNGMEISVEVTKGIDLKRHRRSKVVVGM